MAFGQQAGPPATHRQVQELLGLLQHAGHTDFRDARGPMGFNQRQGAGKFTRDEADAFIAQLQQEAEATESGEPPAADDDGPTPALRTRKPNPRDAAAEQMLRRLPADQLAAELQRRGWVVMEP
jgi:hypothetical protein